MNFSRFLTVQSWWEVPCIAYFCSLFRTAFNLLDFDIEELEEALLTDGTEESASSLLTELIVRLLNGCLGNNDISAFNYQMYLRRIFRQKCQETSRYNPFNTDIDFQFLPLRTKVEILYALCDFRLDAADVLEIFKNLEAESLRVEPLGYDDNDSAFWYFYGTRLYREDIIKKSKSKHSKKKKKENRKRGWFYGDDWLDDEDVQRVWQVVCFTEEDWAHLTDRFSKATSKVEKELYRSLSQNFLPEIPRLFQEKERLQRKRLLEHAPRRTSSRVLQKIKQKTEELQDNETQDTVLEERKETPDLARENRAKRRNLLRSKSTSSDSSDSSESEKDEMPLKVSKRIEKRSKNSSATPKGEPPPEPVVKTGRKTNNSLASATGQIVIPDTDEPSTNSTRKKLKTSQIFSQTEEDIQTDMYKVLEQLLAHEDAWPFMDPVEEEYAPNYYAVIRRPMDLHKMEERLDSGYYTDFSMFKADFKLIVNNCRLYNGQDNEYTTMVDNLQAAFDRLTEKYISRYSSSDEEIAVEYQIPTPSRKHKRKASESPPRHQRKKRKSQSEPEPGSSTSDHVQEEKQDDEKKQEETVEKSKKSKEKESHKSKDEKGKSKKKRKGHHRHGKHSKNRNKKDDKHKSVRHGDSKSKHGKKDKHSKKKDGKKSKKKKKHQEVETPLPDDLKRSESQESLESSNRSRSASPLPSIHTPSPSRSPSPVDLDGPPPDPDPDPEPYKDKFDMIKERRRHAAKDAWESLFEFKQKAPEKYKHSAGEPEKDKHQKLRETIEKLKAKNQKYKDASLFNTLFSPGHSSLDRKAVGTSKSSTSKDIREDDFTSDDDEDVKETNVKGKAVRKKGIKKNSAKNESASEALEQAVKDISKWLDDAPKGSAGSSPCDSPAQTISTEEQDNSRLDDEFSQGEKSLFSKKEVARKRPSSREPKLVKRREIQRTIDRLQPGKSKGNLLTNMANKNTEKTHEEVTPAGPLNKTRDLNKAEESSPKLSLGSVLPTVKFTLGNDHNFSNDEKKSEPENKEPAPTDTKKEEKKEEVPKEKKDIEVPAQVIKKDVEVETEPQSPTKPSQEKATPNLSAWFKAFGAPKTPSATTVKKKVEDVIETEERPAEVTATNDKTTSPKNQQKYDSPTDPGTPYPDGGDSPLLIVSNTPRQRRTSTGSSVSERSSFSQDLDSPRHQMSHTSPLIQSPASPRTDDFQKITYPIINGTVRAGFYQDTTSIRSSPEKSCSPREAPQSPYSPYSPHVYASNNVMGSSTPNYFVDHNKSPLPTYSQNPPPFYDSSKAPVVSKPSVSQDNYTALGPNVYPQNPYSSGQYSPAHSPYPQPPSVQSQNSPQPATSSVSQTPNQQTDAKALFPVKKRTYNEPEVHTNVPEVKESAPVTKNEYQRPHQLVHPGTSMSTTSVDDIALALTEKSEIAKLSGLREKQKNEFSDQSTVEAKESQMFDGNDRVEDTKKDSTSAETNKAIGLKKDNVDMVNMGYMNPDYDKRLALDNHLHDIHYASSRDVPKPSLQHKGYEIDAIAINLGINNQHMHKTATKNSTNTSSMPIPHAHTHERHTEMSLNHNIPHAHHNQYDNISSGQTVSNFSLNDIELANKKLYACNTSTPTAALDYGNWKMTNHLRKPDIMPSDYSSYSSNNTEKLKMDTNVTNAAAINYNKNLQQQQYNTYNNPPRPMLRAHDLQQNLPAELRIPNPRGLLKNDHITTQSALNESDMMGKNMDAAKSQKSDKMSQNHPMVSSMTYKTPYSSHSSLPLDSLRTLQNIPQMLERYTNDERYLSSFSSSASSLYHDKTFQMAQMFNKNLQSEVHPTSTSGNIYSQPSAVLSKDTSIYKNSSMSTSQSEPKTPAKNKRKRATETKTQVASTQAHYGTSGTDVLSSVKSNVMSSSAFNFGTSSNIGLGSGIYGDNSGFSIEDFRNSTNQLMAANYMAAVAHQQQQQRTTSADPGVDKLAKPAHQNSSGAFPFLGAGQVRAAYGFADPSSPLYQQYFQRHQEELLRQTGAQIMGLYPPGYPPGLTRQPYDSINRHSWL